MSKKYRFILILLICTWQAASAQEVKTEKDSARLYKRIEKFSKRSGFTKFVHGLIFEPIKVKKEITKTKKVKVPKRQYNAYEDKIIRDINIVTLDPFGFSENNLTDLPTNYVSRTGNRIHLKSKQLTIKNLLLFKKNRPLDSLLIKESERLIRSQRFVRGVVIKPEIIVGNPDSVDVYIRVLDAWSLIPDLSVSGSRGNFELTERNFLGLGHQYEHEYEKEFSTGDDAYSTRYTVPNIMNTYITGSVGYQVDLARNYRKYVNIDRPFFSPFAKWAGGVLLDQQFRSDSLPDVELVLSKQNFKINSQDYWGGYSYQLFHGNTENARTTNIITTLRYLNVDYTESPTVAYDSIDYYSDEKFYMAGIGLSSRQFIEDKYIFNYGVVEDVPVGRAYGITGGWQDKNQIGRLYLGARVSLGKYYKWGYLSSNFEYGSFFHKSESEQNVLAAQANYFTNLMESGKWKFRQFVKMRMVIGNKRKAASADQLTLDEQNGIPGFRAVPLSGTKKLTLTFQSQAYAPGSFAGFHLNPYFNYSIGMLGDAANGFKNSKAYSAIGLGVIISNDYLVFSTFQFSVAYYPTLPGNGEDIFKTNAFNTEDFGFQNFEISKPRTADYQ